MDDEIFKLTTYDGRYDYLLDVELPKLEIMRSVGLKTHIEKRHPNCISYFDKIQEIIDAPDYVGCNPNEPNSFELVKKYDDNLMIAIKLDMKNNYYYVATLHEVKQSKVNNRLNSGRLKPLNQSVLNNKNTSE